DEAIADDKKVAEVYAAKGAKIVDLDEKIVDKWRAIARDTAWKDYAQKTALSAELLKLAEGVNVSRRDRPAPWFTASTASGPQARRCPRNRTPPALNASWRRSITSSRSLHRSRWSSLRLSSPTALPPAISSISPPTGRMSSRSS